MRESMGVQSSRFTPHGSTQVKAPVCKNIRFINKLRTTVYQPNVQETFKNLRQVMKLGNLLKISLLGGLTITKNGEAVTGLASRKAEALVAYLAYTKRPYARETLADLLWDDRSPKQALGNLRVLLTSLRKRLKPYVIITRQTVAFNLNSNYHLDTAELVERVAATQEEMAGAEILSDAAVAELQQAVAFYRGDFLAGFYLRESRGFEEWALLERERLRRVVIDALQNLVVHHLANRTYQDGLNYAARLLELAPFREEAHRWMMRLLVRTGQRNVALQQYQSCRRLLNEELGVEPMLATTRLYHQIKAISSVGAHNLPSQPTPFIGREAELEKVCRELTRSGSRLLSLVGPGGIGKTRLAIEAAHQCRNTFLRGVCFVPLASLQSEDLLAASIAGSLQLPLSGDRSAKEELMDALREREMLLVLDNFEHFLDGGVVLLNNILQQAPDVRILVTSRERLNLQAERIISVDGLCVPTETDLPNAKNYSAVQLFLQSDFEPTAADMKHIARICQLVEGMPLGIELAAAWTRALSCREIAAEIEESMEFLSVQSRDIPERHRSLGAVFNQSWKHLSEEEQCVFRRLSVFRGGFQYPALRQVAGASLPILTALIDKSFLKKTANERYDVHEMLRQYANKRLEENPQERENVEELYGAYFANFLRQQEESILGSQQQVALAEIEAEIDNIRAMWQWAVEHQKLDIFALSLESLYLFYWARNRSQEGLEAFKQAEKVIPPNKENRLLLARIWVRQGEFHSWLGTHDEVKRLLSKGIEVFQALHAQKDCAISLELLGRTEYYRGEFSRSREHFQKSLTIYHQIKDQYGIALVLNALAQVLCIELTDYSQAHLLLEESLTISRQLGDRYGEARAIINQGSIAQKLKNYDEAKRLFQESLVIYREIDYHHGISAGLNRLGQITHLLGEYETAQSLIEESFELNQTAGNRQAMIGDLKELGNVARAMGAYYEAKTRYIEALQLAHDIGALHQVLDTLTELAQLFAIIDDKERALELLAFALHQPSIGQELKERAENTFAKLAEGILPDTLNRCREKGRVKTMEGIVTKVSAEV